MSGILLPGQQPKPDNEESGGLVLPGGFAGRKRTETPSADAPTAEPPAAESEETSAPQTDTGAPAPSQPSGQGNGQTNGPRARGQINLDNLLFPPQGAQIQCPNCGNAFVVPVFQIIDLGANPELKEALLGGQINAALCPKCGAGGQLSIPLMVHIPDKQFLGVVTPAEARMTPAQSQKMIGDLTQSLMRKLPQEERRGYMLQPRQFADWQSFMEQLWEFEGISRESMRRQRAQSELAQSLMALADDRAALEMAVGRSGDLIDRQFFALVDQLMLMLMRQPGPELQKLAQLRANLLEMTPAGKELGALQARSLALRESITPATTPAAVVDKFLAEWKQPEGRQVVLAALALVQQTFDYNFLLEISQRLEASADESEKAALEEMRASILRLRDQVEASNQAQAQQAQQLLQQLLGAEDLAAALRDNREFLDETFFSVLAATIDRAERNGSTGAVKRLTSVYEKALEVYAEGLPRPERFMNDLITRGADRATLMTLLEENRDLITSDLIENLRDLEQQSRNNGDTEMADLFKSIRAAAALKM